MGLFGILNEKLFGGRPTEYDAQKYFDYAEKQKAKGNFHEALCCYVIIINHGDLGDKPFKAHIELDMQNNNWERVAQSIAAFRKKFPNDKPGWIDEAERKTIKQLKAEGAIPTVVKEEDYEYRPHPIKPIRETVIKPTRVATPKPSTPAKPKPTTTVKPKPEEQQLVWNPTHIYKDPVTGEIVEETDEEYQRKQKEQQKKEKKRPQIVFPEAIEHPTFGERFDNYCASLPPFDFYEGDNESKVPDNAEAEIKDYLDRQGEAFANCKEAIIAGKYDFAEYNLLCMVGYNVWNPDIYEELMHLYCKRVKADELEALKLYSIDYFTKRRERMERQLIALAEQQGDRELAMEYIRKGEKVAYYRGLFDLYDPFPCIERWKQIDTSGVFLIWPF